MGRECHSTTSHYSIQVGLFLRAVDLFCTKTYETKKGQNDFSEKQKGYKKKEKVFFLGGRRRRLTTNINKYRLAIDTFFYLFK